MSRRRPPPGDPPPRRRIAAFARYLAAALSADDAARPCIFALAARIDAGGLSPGDRDAAIEALDDLLAAELDRSHR